MRNIIIGFLCLIIFATGFAQETASVKTKRDFTRLIRQYSISDSVDSANPYIKTRQLGQRVFLSSDPTSPDTLWELAGLGVNLIESQTFPLSTPETAEGVWTWDVYNTEKTSAENYGLDWSFFLHCAFPPEWYRVKYPFTQLTSLSKNTAIPAFSPWSSEYNKFAGRVWEASRENFPQIKVVTFGIHGDYGEAGLMTGQRMLEPQQTAQWNKLFNNAPNFPDFWCGDAAAKNKFREDMLKQYGSLDALNNSWLTAYEKPEEIEYPKSPQGSRRAWLDFVNWYTSGITQMAGMLADTAHKNYPQSLLLLPMGPANASIKIGHDVSSLTKMAGEKKAAIRCANGGYYAYPINHTVTLAQIRAAGNAYNTPVWLASAAPSDAFGLNQRLFEALSIGAVGYYDWKENWVTNSKVVESNLKHMTYTQPVVDVVLLFPSSTHNMKLDEAYPDLLLRGAVDLRDYMDFDIADETLIQDGALSNYKLAVMWEGSVWNETTLAKLYEWVFNGGVLTAYDFGVIITPEGDTKYNDKLFPQSKNIVYVDEQVQDKLGGQSDIQAIGRGYSIYSPEGADKRSNYIQVIRHAAFDKLTPEMEPLSLDIDNMPDGIFSTLCLDRVLYFNTTQNTFTKNMKLPEWDAEREISIKPQAMTVVYRGAAPEEMKFECEAFTKQSSQERLESIYCSPGSGVSALLVKPENSITTGIQINQAGSYHIFLRCLVNGEPAPVEFKINDIVIDNVPTRPRQSDVMDYGMVALSEGVHNITLSYTEPFIADFVIITNEKNIAGYRFSTVGRN